MTAAELRADVELRAANIERHPDSEAREQTCHACKTGEHIDHHSGVWRRYDGSSPVICRCPSCTATQPLTLF